MILLRSICAICLSWFVIATGIADNASTSQISAVAQFEKADSLYACQQYSQAIACAKEALPALEGEDQASCLNLLSICHIRIGDYDSAAHYAQECYQIDLRSGDQDCISSSLNTLASIYMAANLPERAEGYVLKGIEACKQVDNPARLAVLYSTASEIYHAQNDQEQALDYAEKALQIDSQLEGHEGKVAIRQTLKATALIGLKRYGEAKHCLQEAMPVLQSTGNYHSLAISFNKMGELLLWEKSKGEAAHSFAQAAQIFQAMDDPYNEMHSQLGMYNALKDSVPEEAMQHMERHNALKDTIYSREVAQKMARYKVQLDNAELIAEKDKAHSREKHTIFYILLAVFVIVAVIIALLFWKLRRKTKEFVRQFNEMSENIDQLTERIKDTPEPEQDAPAENNRSESDLRFLSQFDEYVQRQIANGHIDVTAIAREMCMSVTTFRRRFSSLIDESPQAYIMRLRMERARKMMDEHPEMTVAEVGFNCGFEYKSNFTRAFKRIYGMTPSEYVASR